MVERVAFAICFAFACAFFFSAFISTPSFVANPRHSSNSPFHTRESERERASVSLNFWATRACFYATEANWQLPHEAYAAHTGCSAASPPAGDVATRRAMNSIKIKATQREHKQNENLKSQKSNREITNKPLEIVVCLFGMWQAMQMS